MLQKSCLIAVFLPRLQRWRLALPSKVRPLFCFPLLLQFINRQCRGMKTLIKKVSCNFWTRPGADKVKPKVWFKSLLEFWLIDLKTEKKAPLMIFSFNTLYYSMSFTFVKLNIQLRLSQWLRSSCDRTKLRKTVYSFSILTPTDSSSPSSTTSRGSGSSPRPPTPTHSLSPTCTVTRRSRTGQCMIL